MTTWDHTKLDSDKLCSLIQAMVAGRLGDADDTLEQVLWLRAMATPGALRSFPPPDADGCLRFAYVMPEYTLQVGSVPLAWAMRDDDG
jgi:hypothetical protein